jgi:hypothetical protein
MPADQYAVLSKGVCCPVGFRTVAAPVVGNSFALQGDFLSGNQSNTENEKVSNHK